MGEGLGVEQELTCWAQVYLLGELSAQAGYTEEACKYSKLDYVKLAMMFVILRLRG